MFARNNDPTWAKTSIFTLLYQTIGRIFDHVFPIEKDLNGFQFPFLIYYKCHIFKFRPLINFLNSSSLSHKMQQFQGNKNLKEFVIIEYPGVVKNLDKAIETLGGMQAISNAHFTTAPLELQFSPENPFHSSLIADRRNQGIVFSGQLNLVLRCRRRKAIRVADGEGTSKQLAIEIENNENSIEIKCLGMISTIYSFRNICDFQYLPLSNTVVSHQEVKVHQDLLPQLVPRDFVAALTWFDDQPPKHLSNIHQPATIGSADGNGIEEVPSSTLAQLPDELELFLPPYQFSRYNNPSKFLLRDEIDHRAVRQQNIGHGKSLRVERKALTITVNAREPFPAEPSDEAMADVALRCKNMEHHRLLTELFKERPLWSRVAIGFRTHINDALLKVILAKYAFYIMSGPWGRLWCRFGYDPRLDPDARKFQSLMVSFKRNQYIPERQRLRTNTMSNAGQAVVQFCDYVYKPGILPTIRQMWYSICDVQLPLAQKICNKGYLETLRECDPILGWLPAGRINSIRRAVKEDVALTSQRLGDECPAIGDEVEELEEEYLEDEGEQQPDEEEDDPFYQMDEEDAHAYRGKKLNAIENEEIEVNIEDY